MLTVDEMYSIYERLCKLYAVAVIEARKRTAPEISLEDISPYCCIAVGKLLGIGVQATIQYMAQVLSAVSVHPDRYIASGRPLREISEQAMIDTARDEVEWIYCCSFFEKFKQTLSKDTDDRMYSRANFLLNCIGHLMDADPDEYDSFIDALKEEAEGKDWEACKAWTLADRAAVVEHYQGTLVGLLSVLKEHSINEGTQILRDGHRIDITETEVFHAWVPFAYTLGIEPAELLKRSPDKVRLFHYDSMNIKRTQADVEQQYIHRCTQAAQAVLDADEKTVWGEEAAAYGRLLQIPERYTLRYIVGGMERLLEESFFAMIYG